MRQPRIAIIEPSTIVAEGVAAILRTNAYADVVAVVRRPSELPALRTLDVDAILLAATYAEDIASWDDLDDITVIGIQSTLVEAERLRRFTALFDIYASEEDILRIVREAIDSPTEKSLAESHELSERERDVLILVARGYTNKEIASELSISPHTVISHRKNIVHKTGIRSVAGLTVFAVLNKLIDSE